MQLRLEITRQEGLRNDLLLHIDRAEIDSARLSVAHRDRLMSLPGIPRHRAATADEEAGFAGCKTPIEDHLRRLGVVNDEGRVVQRAIVLSNRNLGANHGHLAWQRGETPRIFRVLEDPADEPAYSCLTSWRDGRLSIEDLRFDLAADRVFTANAGRDLSDEIDWATAGQRVLRGGAVTSIDEIAHRFYDIRHVLAFDPRRPDGERTRQLLYDGYPRRFRANIDRARRELGVPRARYVHHAIGLNSKELVVVQTEGTIEEIGQALRHAGADDGLIVDNGGSVACWVWWANQYAGGLISPTVDYRPPSTSVLAFILKGPARTELPGGSVSYTVA